MKSRVLILFAHPALEKSRINRRLIDAIRDLPGVMLHDLYQEYPDFDVDVRREQELLLQHDIVVLQFPFYWYSSPALVKEWQDLVLEHGWAYGQDGRALQGKVLMVATSTGGSAASYSPAGSNRHALLDYLLPLRQTAALCGMSWLEPFVVSGTHALDEVAIGVEAQRYRQAVEMLRDGTGERR